MKKQKIQNILTAVIVILVIVLIMIIASIVYEEKINRDKQEIKDTISITEDVAKKDESEEINDEEAIEENEEIEENESKEEYLGEEEQEVEDKISIPMSNDEKAIDLAKKEWGDDNTVTFSIEEKKDKVYYIAVKSNATTIKWYEVNVETEAVSEYY